ncbi:MAG TPA: hypothetical protein VIJ93_08820 [bacterium]
MKLIRNALKELGLFLKTCWFLVFLLAVSLAVYPFEHTEFGVWLSLSYVTSFVFYTLTIYLPERKNKKNIHRVIVPYIQIIISDIKGVFYSFLAASNQQCDVNQLKDGDFQTLFKAINPQDRSTRLEFLGFINWFQYLEHQKGRVKRTVDRVLTYEHYLETDFTLVIESVNNSTFFEILDFIENKPMQYQDFAFLADSYHQCFLLANRLEAYLKEYVADI